MKQSTAWIIGMTITGAIIGAINSITRKRSEKLTQEAMEKTEEMAKDWFKPKDDPFGMEERLKEMERQTKEDIAGMREIGEYFSEKLKKKTPVAWANYPDGRRVGINAEGEEIETSE